MAQVIRRALPGDVDAAVRLVESAYRGDAARRGWTHEADMLGGQRTDREAIAEIIADPQQSLLLLFDGEALVGSVCVSAVGHGACYLGLLSVDPHRQAGGLGRRLIDAAEAEARGRFAARSMEMTVIRQREELIAYYERRGYRRTGEARPFPYGDTRFGLPTRGDLEFEVLEKALA
jgi:ribosomal protein S18 acetylase RimI-like enzyme